MSSDELFLTTLLRALAAEQLEAIIVGTTAAVLQGAPVMTQDVDLLIRGTRRNREKLEALCRRLGAHAVAHDLAGVQTLVGADIPIDVVFDHLPGNLRFESVRSRARLLDVAGSKALVADLADVIASKEAAGRPKDHAQLPILMETLRLKHQMDD